MSLSTVTSVHQLAHTCNANKDYWNTVFRCFFSRYKDNVFFSFSTFATRGRTTPTFPRPRSATFAAATRTARPARCATGTQTRGASTRDSVWMRWEGGTDNMYRLYLVCQFTTWNMDHKTNSSLKWHQFICVYIRFYLVCREAFGTSHIPGLFSSSWVPILNLDNKSCQCFVLLLPEAPSGLHHVKKAPAREKLVCKEKCQVVKFAFDKLSILRQALK